MVSKNEYNLSTKDHCVGNYLAEKRHLLERAIEEMDAPVRIKNVATDNLKRIMPGYVSVWAKKDKNGFCNLSTFWKVYRRLEAESEK